VIARLVTWISTLATLVVVASFGLFALDQVRDGSKQQIAKLGAGADTAPSSADRNVNKADPPPRAEHIRERRHSGVREAIDDANDVLVSPFASAVDPKSIWLQRGLTSLIALLIYGVALRLLAAYLPGGGRR
jgi:hypothetical protein